VPKLPADVELEELHLDILACSRCHLRSGAAHVVYGRGSTASGIMLVGEAPGASEDEEGRPFIGRAGKKLSAWLEEVRIAEDSIYVCNLLGCRPPENRFPEDTGPSSPPRRCLSWIHRRLAAARPAIVVLAGAKALHYVLFDGTVEQAMPFTPHVGKVYRRRDTYGDTRFAIIYHPAYIIRRKSPDDEKLVVKTLAVVRDYAHAKQRGACPPVSEVVDIRTAPPPLGQQRIHLLGV
jgi:DNA polymerase